MDEIISPANIFRFGLFIASVGLIGLWPRIDSLLTKWRVSAFAAGFALLAISHVGFFVLWYLILGHPAPTDAQSFYVWWGQGVLDGKIPGRDLETGFNPLFPYLLAVLLKLSGGNPAIFPATTLFVDLLNFLVWTAILRRFLSAESWRLFCLLYPFDPTLFSFSTMGQDETLFLFGFGLSTLLWLRGQMFLSGCLFSISFLADKFLAAIVAFGLGINGRNTLTRPYLMWLAGAGLPVLVTVVVLLRLDIDLLYPLRAIQGENGFSPGNLPYVLTAFGFDLLPHAVLLDVTALATMLAFAGLLAAVSPATRTDGGYNPLMSGLLIFMLFSIVSRKSWYEVLYLIPLFAALCDLMPLRRAALVWAVFSVAAVLNPSLFYKIMQFHSFSELYNPQWIASHGLWLPVVYLIFQILIVAAKIALLWLIAKPLLQRKSRIETAHAGA